MNPEQLLRKSLQLLSVGSKPKKDDDLEAFENWEELDVERQYELICKEINSVTLYSTVHHPTSISNPRHGTLAKF